MEKRYEQLSPLKYAVLIVMAPLASTALAQDGCEIVEGPFGPQRICPVGPPPPSNSSPGNSGNGGTTRDREAERRQAREYHEYKAAMHERKAAMKLKRRIDALIDKSNAESRGGHYEKALKLDWDAYRLLPSDANLRSNVIRTGFLVGYNRGLLAMARGDVSSINELQRLHDEINALLAQGLGSVSDEAELKLEVHDLQAIIYDLRYLQDQQRRQEVPPPIEADTSLLANYVPLQLAIAWATGGGSRQYVFGMSATVTRDLRNSTDAKLIRYYLYQKYHGRPKNGDSYTNHPAKFGLVGLMTAPTLTEQVVGSFRIDAEVKGNRVRYIARNTTSFTSFAYGKGPNWEATTFRPMSNLRQTYVWWEPLERWPGSR